MKNSSINNQIIQKKIENSNKQKKKTPQTTTVTREKEMKLGNKNIEKTNYE